MDSNRRVRLGAAILGAGGSALSASAAAPVAAKPGDGGVGEHAAALPPGEAVMFNDPAAAGAISDFRYALDGSAPKIMSGGWSKEVTSRQFPIAEAMSGVHMFLDPGASRELHWHAVAAEWAFVIDGHCQTVVLDPSGASEINNFGPGDLWFFPKAHGHSIQTIGDKPCHFILSFDNGDTAPEHETFAITDWLAVTPKDLLSHEFDVSRDELETLPKGEVYIQAGQIVPFAEALEAPWPKASTHKFRLMHEPNATRDFEGGSFRLATMAEWPASKAMSGGLMSIRPGAMLGLHWHPTSNEMNYFLRGSAQVALFGAGGRAKVLTFGPGDVAYYPQGYGHAIMNVGTEDLEIVQTWDNGRFEEIKLTDWIKSSPIYLLANNFAGVPAETIARLKRE